MEQYYEIDTTAGVYHPACWNPKTGKVDPSWTETPAFSAWLCTLTDRGTYKTPCGKTYRNLEDCTKAVSTLSQNTNVVITARARAAALGTKKRP